MKQDNWPYRTTGIPDEMFIRGKVPMTKKEARVIALAQARLFDTAIIYDIGAGTGSFTVEAALCAPAGKVYAIEKEEEGINLISENTMKFAVENVEIIGGYAPEALHGLPQPDRVFIGGSGGNLLSILEAVDTALKPGGRVVANAIVLDNLVAISRFLKDKVYADLEIVQVFVAKAYSMGDKDMLKGSNPVYIVSAEKPIG